MKADNLTNWDAADLARLLAEEYMDTMDLAIAFPSICAVDFIDCNTYPEFMEKNWRFVLASYDMDELYAWLWEKEEEATWEKAQDEYDEIVFENQEIEAENYCIQVMEVADMFRLVDLAASYGFPRKQRHN